MKTKSKKLLLPARYIAITIITLIASILLIACGNGGDMVQPEDVNDDEGTPAQSEMVENGDVVATVNGEEIYRFELDQAIEQELMQYQMQGIDLESDEMAGMIDDLEEQVLDNYFITPTLVRQKAEDEGITVSEEEVEERFQEYADAFGGEDVLMEQMAQANMGREDIDEDIVNELTVQRYLDQYIDNYLEENPEEQVVEDEIEISTDELEEHYELLRSEYLEVREMLEMDDPEVPVEQIEMYYQQLVDQYGEALEEDDFEAVKQQLEDEIRQQMADQMKEEKVQRVLTELVTQLRDESDIEIDL